MIYLKQKYVKTKLGNIIVFSELMQHSDFKHFNPVSAGFIAIGIGKDGNPSCQCYGNSVSLGLDVHEEDTKKAMNQILGSTE